MGDGEVDPVKVIDQNSSSQEPCDAPSTSTYGLYPLRCHDRLSHAIEEHSNFWRIRVVAVSLFGTPAELSFNHQADGLHINGTAEAPGKYAFVLPISFEDSKHE
jgi:hypothetical protein